jgi:hypothetical protein
MVSLVKARRNLRYIPDTNFVILQKAIEECPKTWQELENKTAKLQQARNRMN